MSRTERKARHDAYLERKEARGTWDYWLDSARWRVFGEEEAARARSFTLARAELRAAWLLTQPVPLRLVQDVVA